MDNNIYPHTLSLFLIKAYHTNTPYALKLKANYYLKESNKNQS